MRSLLTLLIASLLGSDILYHYICHTASQIYSIHRARMSVRYVASADGWHGGALLTTHCRSIGQNLSLL